MTRQVFINGRFLGQRITGVQRYGHEVLKALAALVAAHEVTDVQFTVLVPPGTPAQPALGLPLRTVGRLRGHLWEQLELPWYSRGGLLVGLGFTGPLFKRQQIITAHDAAVHRMPEAYHPLFRVWYRLVVGRISRRSAITLAVSGFAAREATACFATPPERLRVVTEGWQHMDAIQADPAILDRVGLRGRPFVLGVSSPTPNKNFSALLQALQLMGADAPLCVVAGAAQAKVFRAAHDGAGNAQLRRVGYVSDGELKALYQHATCFVFPSFYEGFGIPPLEAMAQGCPVIASTAEAVQEVCADAALYFDPHQPAELAGRLRELLASAPLRSRLRSAGLLRAAGYSWAAAARLNLAAIREAVLA